MERIKALYYIDSLGRGGAETQPWTSAVMRSIGIDITFVRLMEDR